MTSKLMLALTLTLAATGCDEQTGDTVGPEGGQVVSDDGRVTLDIPAGALADDVEISIHEVEAEADGAIGTAYQIEPAGVVLSFPAELTFDVVADAEGDAFDLADAVSTMEKLSLVVDKGTHWDRLADHTFDADGGYVSASALYLGTFALTAQ